MSIDSLQSVYALYDQELLRLEYLKEILCHTSYVQVCTWAGLESLKVSITNLVRKKRVKDLLHVLVY